jgi:hypothetical protein
MATVEEAMRSSTARQAATLRPWLSWPMVVAVALMLGVVALPSLHLLDDPDSYWHLAAGQWILAHGQVPLRDPFSHTLPGAPWTAHEWGAEVLFAALYRLGGWPALVGLIAAAYATTMAVLTRFLLQRMLPVHALALVGLAVGMSLSHLLVRPHVLAWLVMVLWLTALVNAVESRTQPRWAAVLLVPLWANLHGSYVLGVLLAGALALEAVCEAPRGQRRAMLRQWAPFIAITALASLLTPSGWHGWSFTLYVTRMTFALSVIQEWASPDFHRPQALQVWLLGVMAAAFAGRLQLRWMRWLLLLGFVHLALKHQRNVALLGMASAVLMARDWAACWYRTASPSSREVSVLDRWFDAWAGPARPAGWAALLAVALMAAALASQRAAQPGETHTPAKALAAARAAGLTASPVLNAYDFGGYLIHEGVPVFIDGRADLYGDPFLRRYLEALQLKTPDSLPELLAQYRIGWTMLPPGSPAVALLARLPGWEPVYQDETAVVHRRVAAVPAAP